MDLFFPCLLDFRHKKRRQKTSFFVRLVGRGKLNALLNLMIVIDFFSL